MAPFAVIVDSVGSWYMCLPFLGAFLNPTGKKTPMAVSKFLEIAMLVGGGWMMVREGGIRNEESIKAMKEQREIVQVALSREIGGLKEGIDEIKVDVKEVGRTLTEHRVKEHRVNNLNGG